MLVLCLSACSTAVFASTSISASTNANTTAYAADDTINTAINTADKSQPISNQSLTQPQTAHERLKKILTSDDYATSKEHKTWEYRPKPKPASEPGWLEKFFEKLFSNWSGSDGNSNWQWLEIFPMLIKGLLIAALIALIVWIGKHASQIQGWINKVMPNKSVKVGIHRHQATPLAQGWESLPAHEQLAEQVKQLLSAGNITEAASVLYRGSLRWLAQNQLLFIAPATTERQCIQQLNQLNQLNQQSLASLPQQYISKIISLWSQVAYDQHSRQQHSARLADDLLQLATNWNHTLPSHLTSQQPPQSPTLAMGAQQ